jgi:APA family basic amino acid/polyamine antiporter
MGAIPNAELVKSQSPYADLAAKIFSGSWSNIISFAAVISCIGTLNGWTIIVGRIPQALANDGLFHRFFAQVNKYDTPQRGILLSAMLTLPFIVMSLREDLIEQFNFIINISIMLILFIYLISIMAYLKFLLIAKDLSFKAVLLVIFSSAFILWSLYAADMQMVATSFFLVIAGIPFRIWFKKSNS